MSKCPFVEKAGLPFPEDLLYDKGINFISFELLYFGILFKYILFAFLIAVKISLDFDLMAAYFSKTNILRLW